MFDINALTSHLTRLFFFGAFLFLGLAVLGKALNLIGQTTPLFTVEDPSVFLNWASTPLLFVIALLLRQIREKFTHRSGMRDPSWDLRTK